MKSIQKTVKKREEYYVEFSDEELNLFNIKKGDKFSWEITDEGVLLKKYVKMDIDISEYPRHLLEFMIKESLEKDVTINEVIIDSIEGYINENNH